MKYVVNGSVIDAGWFGKRSRIGYMRRIFSLFIPVIALSVPVFANTNDYKLPDYGAGKLFKDMRFKASWGICKDDECGVSGSANEKLFSTPALVAEAAQAQNGAVSVASIALPSEQFASEGWSQARALENPDDELFAVRTAKLEEPESSIDYSSSDEVVSDEVVSDEVLAEVSYPPAPGNWTLTFSDDFSGEMLDPQKWRQGQHHLGIGGKAGNSGKNVVLQGGDLELIAENKPVVFAGEAYKYSSGEVSTFKKFRQRYGYFEARIKYDPTIGVWPAFWLMPNRSEDLSEKRSGTTSQTSDSTGQTRSGRPRDKNSSDGSDKFEKHKSESFLRFDIASIGGPVSSALLKIKVKKLGNDRTLANISVHKTLSDNWDENTLNWNNRPEYDPVWFEQLTKPDHKGQGSVEQISQGKELVIDVTDYVNDQVASNRNAGFALVDSFLRENPITFGSRESDSVSDRPKLVIDGNNYTPSADAYVNAGANADSNFGDKAELRVEGAWEITSRINSGGMEFDIIETVGAWGENAVQHAMHWDNYKLNHPKKETGPLDMTATDDGYHTYGMYWKEGYVEFYIDGIPTWEWSSPRVSNVASYILLSHQMGGWGKNQNIASDFGPATMAVDYVRVWAQDVQ